LNREFRQSGVLAWYLAQLEPAQTFVQTFYRNCPGQSHKPWRDEARIV
jgi:hypothetical protein